jgi:hypothetical protein
MKSDAADAKKAALRGKTQGCGLKLASEYAMNVGAFSHCRPRNISNFAFERRHNPA